MSDANIVASLNPDEQGNKVVVAANPMDDSPDEGMHTAAEDQVQVTVEPDEKGDKTVEDAGNKKKNQQGGTDSQGWLFWLQVKTILKKDRLLFFRYPGQLCCSLLLGSSSVGAVVHSQTTQVILSPFSLDFIFDSCRPNPDS